MTDFDPPSVRPIGTSTHHSMSIRSSGIGEAYPVMEQQSELAASSSSSGNNHNSSLMMMGASLSDADGGLYYSQQQQQQQQQHTQQSFRSQRRISTDSASTNLTPRTAGGRSVVPNNNDINNNNYFPSGERGNGSSFSASDHAMRDGERDDEGDAATSAGQSQYSRSSSSRFSRRIIYDEAQSQSSNRTGGILYQSGLSSSRRSFSRASIVGSRYGNREYNGASSSLFASGIHSASNNSGPSSSLRSGGMSSGAPNATALLLPHNDYNPSSHPRIHVGGVSMSGNLLVHVAIEEEPDIELNRDEMQLLANQITRSSEMNNAGEMMHNLGNNNDSSTIGTTRSTLKSLDSSIRQGEKGGIVDCNPNEAILVNNNNNNPNNDMHGSYNNNGTFLGGGDAEAARIKMNKMVMSPSFRKSFFLGICFALLGLGVLLVLENFMRVKSVEDWMEPNRDKYLLNGGGGIDWTFGSDAPKPIAGAEVDYAVEYHLADWARGTSRITSPASLDGFGSVALSETVMFKDVPLFWGLPFAGGAILESVLGQCLNLVQASNKGTQDGRGNDLHLSTVFVMGKKYLNVDLSNEEGIERASALALGTSGMADVVYSPLLQEVSELFSSMNQGRLFIMVRHPVEREFARFRYLQKWDHGKLLSGEEKSDDHKHMSYVEFAHSDHVADNWMTRTLVRKSEDEELTAKDMHTAKEILRRKALIGLYSDVIGAVRHYARYFGWDNAMNGGKLTKGALSCFENAILEGMKTDMSTATNLDSSDALEGSVAWRKIMNMNRFDFELYVYSQQLYRFQIALS